MSPFHWIYDTVIQKGFEHAWHGLQWVTSQSLLKELAEVTRDRDDYKDRWDALNAREGLIWKNAVADRQDRFVERQGRKTRFIALCNLKGGVGKTTLTANLGACLALAGKKVLLVDLDFQQTLSALMLGADQLKHGVSNSLTTAALLKADCISESVSRFPQASTDLPSCLVIPSDKRIEQVDFEEQARFFVNPKEEGKEPRFRFERLFHQPAIIHEYDYVLFDCPPRMTTACINALACADFVLVPSSLSVPDVEAVPRTLTWLKELKHVIRADFLGAVVSRGKMRGRKLLKAEENQRNLLSTVIQTHLAGKEHVFRALVPESARIHEFTQRSRAAVLRSVQVRGWYDPVALELHERAQR